MIVSDSLLESADAKTSVTTVTINLLDVNDNYPLFSPADYSVHVLRSIPIGTQVKTVQATDADSGNNQVYHYCGLIEFSRDLQCGTNETVEPFLVAIRFELSLPTFQRVMRFLLIMRQNEEPKNTYYRFL